MLQTSYFLTTVFYYYLCPQGYLCLLYLMLCHYPSLPNLLLSDTTLVACNWLRWKYLHWRKQQTLQIRGFFQSQLLNITNTVLKERDH